LLGRASAIFAASIAVGMSAPCLMVQAAWQLADPVMQQQPACKLLHCHGVQWPSLNPKV